MAHSVRFRLSGTTNGLKLCGPQSIIKWIETVCCRLCFHSIWSVNPFHLLFRPNNSDKISCFYLELDEALDNCWKIAGF